MTEIPRVLARPLYHGTSTVFLEGIREAGLGGRNLIKEWDVLALAARVLELGEVHLQQSQLFQRWRSSFSSMVRQESGQFNWQHGQPYLSPSRAPAIRYAINKKYGSELLSYTLELLSELVRLEQPEVIEDLYQRHRALFGLLDASPAPLVIEASAVPVNALLTESGAPPDSQLQTLAGLENQPEMLDLLGQQLNFRLVGVHPSTQLTFWFVNIMRWHHVRPETKLYRLQATLGGVE
jgi:hypothetical protein